jgi:hypothetical protein
VGLTRLVRSMSEKQLMAAAQREVALRYGAPLPPRPRGLDVFWQRIYVPVYHALPWTLRAKVMTRMPGSHREVWHPPPQARGPAV